MLRAVLKRILDKADPDGPGPEHYIGLFKLIALAWFMGTLCAYGIVIIIKALVAQT